MNLWHWLENWVIQVRLAIQKGWYKCIPVIFGISVGFLVLLGLSSMGIGTLLASHETVYIILKYIAAIYLLYLAYLLIRSAKGELKVNNDINVTFIHVSALQLINPKAWVMAISVIVTFADNTDSEAYLGSTILIAIVFTVINLISNSIWGLGGIFIRNTITSPFALQKINISMGVLLAVSVVMMIL